MTLNLQQIHNIKRLRANTSIERGKAELRNIYFSQDNTAITQVLRQDMLGFMDNYDISKLRLVTYDSFVKSFVSKIALVHKSPMIIKIDSGIPEEEQAKLQKLFNEIELQKVLQDTEMRMKLHNTLLVGVRYFEKLDKMYLENSFDAGTTEVIGYDGFEQEAKLAFRRRFNKLEEEEWLVWDRESKMNYLLREYPKYDFMNETMGGKMLDPVTGRQFEGVQSYWPFVKYQAADQNVGYWGNGFDSLVELTRTIHVLLTVLSDDTISETLRILLMNFVPIGGDGEPGQYKVGMRNPIIAQTAPGEEANVDVVSAELYTEDILAFVDKLVDSLSSIHGIDSVLTKDITADITALATQIKNEHLLRTWQQDTTVIRKYDYELLAKIIEVNNFHRQDNQIDPEILEGVSLDYQTPNYVVNETDDYTLEKLKWQDGTSSPLLYVMRRNPEFTRGEAEKYIADNLIDTNNLLGLKVETISEVTGSEFDEIVA